MRTRRGGALIVTLAVLGGLIALVVSYAAAQHAAFRTVIAQSERAHARKMAETAIQRAMAEMVNIDENAVLLSDEWAQLGEYRGENFVVSEGSFRFEIVDEGSLINLNTASQEQLANLGLTTEQIDCLLDWREPGEEPRTEGAKDEYYNNLPTPYNAALAPLTTLDEILLVKGFTARTLYELPEDTETTQPLTTGAEEEQPVLAELATLWSRAPYTGANGQARVNANTANQQQLVQAGIPQQLAMAIIQRRNTQGTFTTLGQVLTVNGVNLQNAAAILNNLGVNTSTEATGKLNLNTATEAALNSLPNSTPDITQAILTRQEQGFTGVGDLASVPGVSLQWLQQNADGFVTGSRVFRVRAIGRYHEQRMSLEAVISIAGGTPTLIGIFETPDSNMQTRWRWAEQANAEVVLAEAP